MKQPTTSEAPNGVSSERRSRLLRETSEAAGATWALTYLDSIQESGRRIEGGWPGTLPEARMRMLSSLPQALSAQGLAPLSPQEIIAASSITSAEAKRCWQIATKRHSRSASHAEHDD
jgi:hypothetical protein